MDVVYPIRLGSNEELRYSLRSLKNIEYDEVFILGKKPPWVTGVNFMEVPQSSDKNLNTTRSMLKACECGLISDPFIWMNDDFFILQPTEIGLYHRGTLEDFIAQHKRIKSAYMRAATDNLRFLERKGFHKPLCYELHLPIPIYKEVMLEALRLGAESKVKIPYKRSLYGNLLPYDGVLVEDVKVIPGVHEMNPLMNIYLSGTEQVFADYLEPMMQRHFPEPSRYEKE